MHKPPIATWRGAPLSAVLFDLDGTLVDTAGDIALALNRTMLDYGWTSLADHVVRRMIGRGSSILIERAAAEHGRTLDEPARAAMEECFFHHYGRLEESEEVGAKPYAGAREALQAVHDSRLPTAVVTNKPHRFADRLLQRLGLSCWVDVVIGGDSCERRKPHPQQLFFACESLRVPAAGSLMVGDSANDVQAARAAGMPVICVTYGYNHGHDIRQSLPDAVVDSLTDVPPYLRLCV